MKFLATIITTIMFSGYHVDAVRQYAKAGKSSLDPNDVWAEKDAAQAAWNYETFKELPFAQAKRRQPNEKLVIEVAKSDSPDSETTARYNQATNAANRKSYATSPDFKETVFTPGQVFQRREALQARKTQGDKDAFVMPTEERMNDFAARKAAFNNKAAKTDSRANKTKTAKRKRVVSKYEKTIADKKASNAKTTSRGVASDEFDASYYGNVAAARANLKKAFKPSTMPKKVSHPKRKRVVSKYEKTIADKKASNAKTTSRGVASDEFDASYYGNVAAARANLKKAFEPSTMPKKAKRYPSQQRRLSKYEKRIADKKASNAPKKDWRKERVFEFGSVRDQRDLIEEKETQILLKQSKPQYDSAMKELMRKRKRKD